MSPVYRCDQCSYEEWRQGSDGAYLCPVCGYMRWGEVRDPEHDAIEPTEDSPGHES